MEFSKEMILRNTRFLISSIYGILIWMTRFSSSNKASKYLHVKSGLAILVCSCNEERMNPKTCKILHSYNVSAMKSLSSSLSSYFASSLSSCETWASSTTGDLLGTESGVHMGPCIEGSLPWNETRPLIYRKETKDDREGKKNKYPPPISSLRPDGHRGFYFSREYVHGRLILRKEIVEDFNEDGEAVRENDPSLSKLQLISCEDEQGTEDEKVDDKANPCSENLITDEMVPKDSHTVFSSSLPNSCLKSEVEREAKLQRSYSFSEELVFSTSFVDAFGPTNTSINTLIEAERSPISPIAGPNEHLAPESPFDSIVQPSDTSAEKDMVEGVDSIGLM